MARPRVEKFFHGVWFEEYDPFGDDDYRKSMVVDDKEVLVEILEYHYGEPYHPLLPQLFDDTNVFIFILDVTAKEEFESFQKTHAIFLGLMRSNESTPQRSVFPSGPTHKTSSKYKTTQKVNPQIPQTFTCFPRLPKELQLAVLRAALTSPDPIPIAMPNITGINLNILKACKFFYEEGSKIFWKENTFSPMKPMTLVAETGFVSPTNPRVVTTEEGQKIARSFGCKYVELSSRQHEPVEGVVIDLIRDYRALVAATSDESESASQAQNITNRVPRPWRRMFNGRNSKEGFRSLGRSFRQRASRIFVTKSA
ncbi:hypothetical protein GX51_02478 [Blastomyces parvus]|uniref:Uncharacterized protein n=1 Tax=Blastomyces parvus TaxID=2060905 RepID=A0A2B7XBY8_9EURO|nr:hypothetical protein GX51_02478 [Blastomyces parvus]